MVSFMCHLDRAKRCPDSTSFLGVSVGVSPGEISLRIHRLIKKIPSPVQGDSSLPTEEWNRAEQNTGVEEGCSFSVLLSWATGDSGSQASALQSLTLAALQFQACGLGLSHPPLLSWGSSLQSADRGTS